MAATIQTIQKPTRARALDTSGNNNHGQIYSGRALEFDGVSDYLYTASSGLQHTTTVGERMSATDNRTIAFWHKSNGSISATENIFSSNASAGGGSVGYGIHLVTAGELFMENMIKNSAGSNVRHKCRFVASVDESTWKRYVCVFDAVNSTMICYINGVSASLTATGETLQTTWYNSTVTSNVYIGALNNTPNLLLDGYLSDFQGWTAAFSADDAMYDYLNPESLAINRGGTSLASSNLKLWYPMQDGHRGQQSFVLDGSDVAPASKNHATTVFYGDEQISVTNDRTFAGASNWQDSGTTANQWAEDSGTYDEATASGATEGTALTAYDGTTVTFTDNYLKLVATSDGSDLRLAELDGANWEDSDDMVVGRTYRLSYAIEITAYTSGTFSIGFGDTDVDTDADKTYTATKSVASDYFDFVYKGTTTHAKLFLQASTSSAFTLYLDNFSLKEVGTATGWTDADQQLDIPQTALQSYNQLAWFEGSDETVIVADTSNDNDDIFDGGGSVSAWIHPIGIGESSEGCIISKTNGTAGESGWILRMEGESGSTCEIGFLRGHDSTDGSWDTDDRVITYGKWTHIVITYDDDAVGNNPIFYINGSAVDSADVVTPVGNEESDASQVLTIGNRTGATDRTFAGCITEVSLWGTVLSVSEVSELYNSGNALDATTHSESGNLKGYWRNNGLVVWQDLTSNNNDGTPTNVSETMLIPAGVDGSRDNQGFLMNRQKDTNALNLNSYDNSVTDIPMSYVDLGSATTIDAGTAYSVMVWLKPDDLVHNYIMGTGTTDWFVIKSSTTLALKHNDVEDVFTISALTAEEWVHIAFVRNTSNLVTVYVNGDTNGGATLDTETADEAFDYRYIGARNVTQPFRGAVDDFLIYSDELSAAEITRNYNAGKRSHR